MSSARSTARPMLGGLFVVVLAFWLVVGCAELPGQKEQKKGAPPVAGSFVGEMPDVGEEGAFVALVASGVGEEGDEREVRAYLCDGESIFEWFTGSAIGNDLSLTSGGGAQLEGALAPGTATGTITLADESGSFPFSAPLATGVANLYDVTVFSDGRVRGTSETGAQLEGRVGSEPQGRGGLYSVTGTITPPDGQPQDFETFASADASGELRWIVLEDRRVKGGPKRREGTGFIDPTSGGFIDPTTQE